jgi:hypothetical protein
MPEKVDLARERPKLLARGGAGMVVCAIVLTSAYLWPGAWMPLPEAVADRIGFALRADAFVILWVLIAIQRVSSGRYNSPVDNRGSAYGPPSPALALKIAFLQNTLEQAFVAIGAHLALSAATGGAVLALIPASVLLFAVGRAAFLIGYPHGAGGRAFGIVMTMVPSYVLLGIALWHIVARAFG